MKSSNKLCDGFHAYVQSQQIILPRPEPIMKSNCEHEWAAETPQDVLDLFPDRYKKCLNVTQCIKCYLIKSERAPTPPPDTSEGSLTISGYFNYPSRYQLDPREYSDDTPEPYDMVADVSERLHNILLGLRTRRRAPQITLLDFFGTQEAVERFRDYMRTLPKPDRAPTAPRRPTHLTH